MSVLVKGMEMPECCDECVFMETQDSGFGNDYICGISKQDVDGVCDCPLVPIPPHGRLIDADALLADVRAHSESYFADDFAHEWVDVAPTVIPADKDGEA